MTRSTIKVRLSFHEKFIQNQPIRSHLIIFICKMLITTHRTDLGLGQTRINNYVKKQSNKMSSENAEISLKLSEQEVLIRKDALEDTYVKSKISGIVVTKNIEEGEMIGGGSDLFTIINLNKIEVVFEVSESDLPNVELNRPIIFSTPSYPSLYFKAKIQRISWTSNPETGLFPVFALGENKDNLLRIGMSTKIYLLN